VDLSWLTELDYQAAPKPHPFPTPPCSSSIVSQGFSDEPKVASSPIRSYLLKKYVVVKRHTNTGLIRSG